LLCPFFLVFFWFFVWRVQYSIHEEQWSSSVRSWVYCIASNAFPAVCGAHPSARLASWTWYGIHAFLGMQGIILTLTWGTQLDNFILWRKFIAKNCGCAPKTQSSKSTIQLSKNNDKSEHPSSNNSTNHATDELSHGEDDSQLSTRPDRSFKLEDRSLRIDEPITPQLISDHSNFSLIPKLDQSQRIGEPTTPIITEENEAEHFTLVPSVLNEAASSGNLG